MVQKILGQKTGNSMIPYSPTTQRTKTVDNSVLAVVATGGATPSIAEAFAYADSNGEWWITGVISCVVTSATSASFQIAGISLDTNSQGFHATTLGAAPYIGTGRTSGSTLTISSSAVFAEARVSFNLKLAAAPTWAAANMEASTDASIYIEPASAGASGIIDNSAANVTGTPIKGKTDGVAVDVGYIGEIISQGTHNAATPSSAAQTTICAMTLTAGIWDVSGGVYLSTGSGTTTTVVGAGISLTTNAWDIFTAENVHFLGTTSFPASSTLILPTPIRRIQVTSNTNIYMVARTDFTGGTNTFTANKSFIRGVRVG
jgi:hypothetical protein